MSVSARIFLALGAFLVGVAVLYGITSDEESGTLMLLLSGVLALWVGIYLARTTRYTTAADGDVPAVEETYLPHESVWPFWIGVGAFVIANGLALGLWGLIPGAVVIVAAVWGFSRQSRRRD